MLNILLIDDNQDDRALAIYHLRQAFPDSPVIEVGTAASFSQAMANFLFDVVITDYQLHWSDGLTILKTIKSHYPDCVVIMFTSTATQQTAIEAMKLGLDDYVIKSPHHYVRLPAAVETTLERVAAQQQAANLQVRIQTLLDRLNVGVYRITLGGELLEGNAAFLQLLGLSALTKLPLNETLESYFHPHDYAALTAQPLRMDEVRDREVQLCCADGTTRWVKISNTFVRVDGTILIDGLMEDISARKRTETQAELDKQRTRFLTEASQLLTSSLDYRRVLANVAQMAVPMLADWCFVDIVEKTGVDFTKPVVAAVDPDKEQLVLELRKRYPPSPDLPYGPSNVLRTGKPELISELSETIPRAIAQNEEHYALLCQLQATSYMVVPMSIGDRILGTIAFVSSQPDCHYNQADLDMALELGRRAAIALDNAQLYEDAQQANRAKDEFLAVVSHELRNPLNSMLGWSQLLRRKTFEDPTIMQAIDTIARNARLQNKLIEDLLDVSRIIQNRLEILHQPVYLAPIIDTAIKMLLPNAEAKSIQILSQLDLATGQVMGDSERLGQIVSNLLSNAIKFTPQGGRVEVHLTRVNAAPQDQASVPTPPPGLQGRAERPAPPCPYAQITITDTGQGIASDFLPFIFERFRQADASKTRAHTGLGLGLAIVHHLVELHGGRVYAASGGKDQGATFTVQLPIQDSASIAYEASTPPLQLLPTFAGLRILMVDDDVDNRELIAFILEQQQAQVTTAASAAIAFEIILHTDLDLLICDIGMPDEDGYSLLRRIRELDSSVKSQIPAIALTAFAKEEDQRDASKAGFQRHLSKPVNPDDLIYTIANLMQIRQ